MNTATRPTRHRYGLTDRLNPPKVTRWWNVISVGPELARLEAERDNPGFTAHDVYITVDGSDFGKQLAQLGMQVWRVELWKDPS